MVIDKTKNQRQNRVLLKDLSSWSFLLCLSIFVNLAIFLWLPKGSAGQWVLAGMIILFTTITTMIGAYWLVFRYLPSRLRAYTNVWKFGVVGTSLLAGIWLSLNLFIITPPPQINSFVSPFTLKLAYRLGIGLLLGLALCLASTWLATAIPAKKPLATIKPLFVSAIKYVIPIILVWGIYLLAFYPAMMSADSMDQWGQAASGVINDHHPAFHTMLIWLLTQLYYSPTTIALAQMLALAIVAGLWFAFFETLGIHRWVIWFTAFIFAVVPVNGTMVNTLWKDIPYSTAVLGLTLIIARIVVTRGEWILSTTAQIILGITAALVLLLRHDGVMVGVGTLLLLILSYPRKWKSWLVPCILCAVLYFGIRGPIYSRVGVTRVDSNTAGSFSLYSIVAFTTPGSETDQLISSIQLDSSGWSCDIGSDITPQMRSNDVDPSTPRPQLLENLLRHLPNLLSYYFRCARSMEWVIWDPNTIVFNPSHAEVWIDPNPYGILPASKIPVMREWLSRFVVKTAYDPNYSWLIWRPAIYLYLNLFLIAVLVIRNRNLHFGLQSVPILIQSISFSLILAAPNFRYHYAVFLISLISIPLFFSPPSVDHPARSGSQPTEV